MSAYSYGSVRRLNSFGHPQRGERFGPDSQRALAALLDEHGFPVLEPHRDEFAVVGEVEEAAPRAVFDLTRQVRQQVEAVDVDLVLGLSVGTGLVALLQLLDDVGFAGGGQECRQPVVVLDDVVGHRARLDLSRPADHLRNPERALPVGVLLAAERRGARVGPAVAVRPVVGASRRRWCPRRCRVRRGSRALCRRCGRGRSSNRGSPDCHSPACPRLSGLVWV